MKRMNGIALLFAAALGLSPALAQTTPPAATTPRPATTAPTTPAPAAPAPTTAATPAECIVKGNVNRKGEKIYHLPGEPGYDRIKMNKGRGERCFRTKEEAEAAGWRPMHAATRN